MTDLPPSTSIWDPLGRFGRPADPDLPRNLPLPPVNYQVEVWPADIEPAGAVWPPPRAQLRNERFEALWAASENQLDRWLPPGALYAGGRFNRFQALATMVQSLLTDTPPEAPDVPTRMLVQAVDRGVWDMLVYGRALVVWMDDPMAGPTVVCPDIRFSYPLGGDDGWIVVVPVIGRDSMSGEPTAADVTVITEGTATVTRRVYTNNTALTALGASLGQVVDGPTSVPAVACHADRGPIAGSVRGGWGRSLVEDALTLLVEYAMREQGVSRTIAKNERPLFVVESPTVDIPASARISGIVGSAGDDADTETAQSLAQAVRGHDVRIMPDGLKAKGYMTWDSNMAASFMYLDRLDELWTLMTGMAPMESADSGDTPSGIALARRQAQLVVRARRLYVALLDALTECLPRPPVWPFIDTLAQAAGDDNPDPDRNPQPDVEVET